mgnify:CR=1 FL=1
MFKNILLFVCLLSTFLINAQDLTQNIKGKVIDNSSKQPIAFATVVIIGTDPIIGTTSDMDGNFIIENVAIGRYDLQISYLGYEPIIIPEVVVTSAKEVVLTITLTESPFALDEVVIKSRSPITIKKDTLEFNVKSFKTKKDASVEDLLKKLPGVEVDEEGKITVNGKPVNKILVNGKPFFGNDPTIATKNLTKEIIEKVQITDTKTKSEAFTGQKGDQNNKTINLTIKEENNRPCRNQREFSPWPLSTNGLSRSSIKCCQV